MSGPWSIIEHGFDVRLNRAREGLFTLGSGSLHVRGSLEEHLSDAPQNVEYLRLPANVTSERFPETKACWGTYVPGLFGRHPLLNHEMINLPWFLGLCPWIDGQRLDMERCRIRGHRRELRLDTATLIRELHWQVSSDKLAYVHFERFVSAVRPRLCAQRIHIQSAADADLRLCAGIDADVRTNGYDHLLRVDLNRAGPSALECRAQTDMGEEVYIHSELRGPALEWEYDHSGRRAELVLRTRLPAGTTLVVEKRSAVVTSRDPGASSPQAILRCAANLTFEQLHAEHAAEWQRRWEACDVQIDGDERSQLALRVSLYHLLRCHPGEPRVAIDGKGYSGEAYWGRFFWDTEMFLLPFFLYTEPQRARSLVDFRVLTLPGARENARRYGYPGARYAWESDADGRECCPNWQYADHEVHVTADVVYGLAHYAAAADDPAYLTGPAAQVIVETARYWLARVDWRDGRPVLLGVMGPDEYTPISHNNAFTNRMVAFALRLAARVGPAAGASAEECYAFLRVAEGLPLPCTSDGLLVLQCEGFERLADPRFEELWRDLWRVVLFRGRMLAGPAGAALPHQVPQAGRRADADDALPGRVHRPAGAAGLGVLSAADHARLVALSRGARHLGLPAGAARGGLGLLAARHRDRSGPHARRSGRGHPHRQRRRYLADRGLRLRRPAERAALRHPDPAAAPAGDLAATDLPDRLEGLPDTGGNHARVLSAHQPRRHAPAGPRRRCGAHPGPGGAQRLGQRRSRKSRSSA